MNNILIGLIIIFILFMILDDIVYHSKKTDRDIITKHNMLLSCGFRLMITPLGMEYWQRDENRIVWEEDLKYLTLKELEEIVK